MSGRDRGFRMALAAGIALVLTGCGGSPAAEVTTPPTTAPLGPPSPGTGLVPDTDLSGATVAYLTAWAANDVATMVGNSAPGSPARGYARYWGDVYRAGRLDSGTAELMLGHRSAVLTYPDAAIYRMTAFVDRGGLVTWSARPGGPLGPRMVSGPPVSTHLGGVRVTALRQYVNTESGLRVSLKLRNSSTARRDIQIPSYVSAGGVRRDAAVGSDGRTGVVPLSSGSRSAALVAAEAARPGGRLLVRVYDRTGAPVGEARLALPD